MPRSSLRRVGAFTLVELLAVIAITGIIAALAVAGINRTLRASRSAACLGNLRQLGVAAQQYAAEHRGATPGYSWFYPHAESAAATRGTLAPYLNAPARWTDDARSVLTCPELQSQFPSGLPAKNTYSINGYCTSIGELGDALAATTAAGVARTLRLSDSAAPGRQAFFFDGLPQNQIAGTDAWYYRNTGFSSDSATYARFVHNDFANVVFLDGHCEQIRRATFLAYPATHLFWTGR